MMIAQGIPAGRVYRAPDMLADPHFAAREAIVEVETARFGPLKMQAPVPRFSATPSTVRRSAPALGEHNGEIYGEMLGVAPEALARLAEAGVI